MKKMVCLGMVAILILSVGCRNESVSEVAHQITGAPEEVNLEVTETILKMEEITEKDFKPFFEALYGYQETEFDQLNRNPEITYEGYFTDLQFYRDKMSEGLGGYFSKALRTKLASENTKLDFDLPKKVHINDYVLEAHGEIDEIKVTTSRELGEHLIYEVEVTSNHIAIPEESFYKIYGWSNQLGYVATLGSISDITTLSSVEDEEETYIYSQHEDVQDFMKIISRYWVEVSEPEAGSKLNYQIEGLKQAGNFEVDYSLKESLENTQYIERIPYYKSITNQQKKMVLDVMCKLLRAPEETYQYYDKVFNNSYQLYEKFWEDLGVKDKIITQEETYKVAFKQTMNPYKDNIIRIDFDEKHIDFIPSIYSTKLQPNVLMTIPAKVLKNDNTMAYYTYTYLIYIEDDKIEGIQFIKMDEMNANKK